MVFRKRLPVLIAAYLLGVCAVETSAGDSPPEPIDILRRSLMPPEEAYDGMLIVKKDGVQEESSVKVQFAPPANFRHKILDASGRTAREIISDGKTEWVYDPGQAKLWKGEPPRPDGKRRDPNAELALMAKNYKFRVVKEESVAGRPAWEVEVASARSGRVVRRVWIDQAYGLVLRTASYGEDGKTTYEAEFKEIRIPAALSAESFRFQAPPGISPAPDALDGRFKPDSMHLKEVRDKAGIDPHVPDEVPAGYAFESAGVIPYRKVLIVHYRYSDGIDVLSLFQMPAKTRFSHHGPPVERPSLRRVRAPQEQHLGQPSSQTFARARLFLDGDHKLLEWRRGEYRYVLVGQMPLAALRRVAESVQ